MKLKCNNCNKVTMINETESAMCSYCGCVMTEIGTYAEEWDERNSRLTKVKNVSAVLESERQSSQQQQLGFNILQSIEGSQYSTLSTSEENILIQNNGIESELELDEKCALTFLHIYQRILQFQIEQICKAHFPSHVLPAAKKNLGMIWFSFLSKYMMLRTSDAEMKTKMKLKSKDTSRRNIGSIEIVLPLFYNGKIPTPSDTIVFQYLALLLSRQVVTVNDLLKWIENGSFPFRNLHNQISFLNEKNTYFSRFSNAAASYYFGDGGFISKFAIGKLPTTLNLWKRIVDYGVCLDLEWEFRKVNHQSLTRYLYNQMLLIPSNCQDTSKSCEKYVTLTCNLIEAVFDYLKSLDQDENQSREESLCFFDFATASFQLHYPPEFYISLFIIFTFLLYFDITSIYDNHNTFHHNTSHHNTSHYGNDGKLKKEFFEIIERLLNQFNEQQRVSMQYITLSGKYRDFIASSHKTTLGSLLQTGLANAINDPIVGEIISTSHTPIHEERKEHPKDHPTLTSFNCSTSSIKSQWPKRICNFKPVAKREKSIYLSFLIELAENYCGITAERSKKQNLRKLLLSLQGVFLSMNEKISDQNLC